jgi:hypothetical protein
MRYIICILTILTITTSDLLGQVKKCDGTILLLTSKKMGRLTQKEITDFLLTFGQECRNNVEYSEWSNELLFLVLDKQTDLTVRTIEKEEKRLELEVILDDLSEPLLDPNIRGLITKVDIVKIKKELKDKIIASLKTADGKAN